MRSAEAADKAQQLEQAQQRLTEAAAQYSELQVPPSVLARICSVCLVWRPGLAHQSVRDARISGCNALKDPVSKYAHT